jgi:glycosyltransferase involved in cell wall biosynthesis
MNKPTLLFRGPVETRSGYGAHSRDLLESLYQMNLFDIKIDSCAWGYTPRTALEENNMFHTWIRSNIVNNFIGIPDFYIQVTVPNEFQRLGRFNIGITAGIETTIAPKNWVDGCNRMDLVITTSKFSKDVLLQTIYNETEKLTGKLINQHKINKPIDVLFEGVDTKIFNNVGGNFDLDIKEDFAYIFVGHWLKGEMGQDRKDVGMLIKCFMEAFNGKEDKPALILKTSQATFSVKEREVLRKKIQNICIDFDNPPSVYLLFGELTNEEMNSLYNHPKVKSMVSITKGEGFGRPLLEFSMTGKPIIASNWSGHKDFLPMDKAVMIGGSLVEVHDSVVDDFIIKGSKWFKANYNEFAEVMIIVKKDYEDFKENSEKLRIINSENFSLSKMTEKFKQILLPFITEKPKEHKLQLPKLTKVKQ